MSETNDTPKIEVLELDALLQDPVNANRGTDAGHELLQRNIEALGLARGIVADRNNVIIGGNQITKAAAAYKERTGRTLKVVAVDTDGDTLVVNRRMDLDLSSDTDNRGRAVAIADNTVQSRDLDYDIIGEQVLAFDLPVDLLGIELPSMDVPEVADEAAIGESAAEPMAAAEDVQAAVDRPLMPLRDREAEQAAVDNEQPIAPPASDPKPLGEVKPQFGNRWALMVEFPDETSEKEWYEKLTAAGFDVQIKNMNYGG